MASENFMKQLKKNPLYQFALKSGLLGDMNFNIHTKKEMDYALFQISEIAKEHEKDMNAREKEALDAAQKLREQFEKEVNPDPTKKTIAPEDEGKDGAKGATPEDEGKDGAEGATPENKEEAGAEKGTVTAELLGESNEEPEDVPADDNWVEQKKSFWKAFAERRKMEVHFENPEADSTVPLFCALSKEGKSQGEVAYPAENKVLISQKSEFAMYQGVVEEVAASGNTLTLGDSLTQQQKLMFYAASIGKTYEKGEPFKVINPPLLNEDLFKSQDFAALPKEVQSVLRNKYNAQQKKLKESSGKEEECDKSSAKNKDEKALSVPPCPTKNEGR